MRRKRSELELRRRVLTLTASHVVMRGSVRAWNTCGSSRDSVQFGSRARAGGGRRGAAGGGGVRGGGTLASVSQRTTPGNSLVVLNAAAASGEP